MCGIIANFYNRSQNRDSIHASLEEALDLIAHRGPDGVGFWVETSGYAGAAHCRLSIIDIEGGAQPMSGRNGCQVVFNGEIYNHIELREELSSHWDFTTKSDTEVLLAAYSKWGQACVSKFRGMFAFAIWDPELKGFFCARDHFGIKPLYYCSTKCGISIASEAKALLPYLERVEVNIGALRNYLHFQLYLDDETLFKGINELKPAHWMTITQSGIRVRKYWELNYEIDFTYSSEYCKSALSNLTNDSIKLHLRSDVEVGAYLSGGLDSSIISLLASSQKNSSCFTGFNGRFAEGPSFDESIYAYEVAQKGGFQLKDVVITAEDFIRDIRDVIWHLDYPVAGPGSFPQYCVSRLASKNCKVVLGGQGGDELFGGYARYLIAYFEQCIKGAIQGTLDNGSFLVTYESIIPSLRTLQGYEPMLSSFWKEGLFESMDNRYYRLVHRGNDYDGEINWSELGKEDSFEKFSSIYHADNVNSNSYFDKMTHFDFKTLLPALLQVEDRMSMAHGLESRVPFLDVPLVEFSAKVPADIKFHGGKLKRLLHESYNEILPSSVRDRKDKMGFPVPLQQWANRDLKDFIVSIFETQQNKNREFFNSEKILASLKTNKKFPRSFWGLLSLELWFQEFID